MNAVGHAKEAGNLDPDGAGSPTHPEITRTFYGDGKTIRVKGSFIGIRLPTCGFSACGVGPLLSGDSVGLWPWYRFSTSNTKLSGFHLLRIPRHVNRGPPRGPTSRR